MSDFGEGKTVKCRKDHRCEWCGEKIPAGDQAFYYAGLWDGDWQSWYMHPECEIYSYKCDAQDGFEPFSNERPKEKKYEGIDLVATLGQPDNRRP
jgi:hypothetical protein